MIISGHNNRSVSTQSGGVLDIRVNFENEIKDFDIGLTGASFFGISCREGILSINDKPFDSLNNNSKDFRLVFSNAAFDLYRNGQILINGGLKTSDSYENILISTNSIIDCDVSLSGKEPSLDFSILNGSESGNSIITGLLTNGFPDRRFRIFNASVDTNSSAKFAITGWDSGICDNECMVRLVSLEDTPVPTSGVKIDFDSNFGPFSINTDIPSSFTQNSEYFSVSPNQNTFFNAAGSKLFNVTSFFQGPDRNLQVELSFVSGGLSSQLVSLESGVVSGSISGVVKGCGTINGTATNYLTGIVGMSGLIFSGDATGSISKAICHTGELVWTGQVQRSGIIPSGVNSGQVYRDYLNLSLTGTVLGGSGYYVFQNTYTENVSSGGVVIPVTGNLLYTGYLYSTLGIPSSIGTQNVEAVRTTEICGTYNGATSIFENVNYFYNEDGWSGFIPTAFNAYYVPTGVYSGPVTVTGSGLIPATLDYFTGTITGTATGLINNGSGCSIINGTLTGLYNYELPSCVQGSGVYAGDVAPTVVPLYDYYGTETGLSYNFNFSTFTQYLVGSGKPCALYLSGFVYEMDPLKTAIDISSILITIRNRQNNAILQTGYLNDYVRGEYMGISEYEFRIFDVYRKNFLSLLNFDATGDINIFGTYQTSGTTYLYDTNYMRLTVIPFNSGIVTGSAPITGDYSVSRCLTGSVCLEGTGTVDGNVTGLFTILNGTGIGSGRMLGPEVPIPFVDMWDLKTGIGNFSYDYKNSGWFEGGVSGKFSRSGGMVTKQNLFNTPFVEVYYNRSLNLSPSVAKLSVFDGFNLEEILISGR